MTLHRRIIFFLLSEETTWRNLSGFPTPLTKNNFITANLGSIAMSLKATPLASFFSITPAKRLLPV